MLFGASNNSPRSSSPASPALAAAAAQRLISAYNYGFGAVDAEADDGDQTYHPNHRYIENVRALMTGF